MADTTDTKTDAKATAPTPAPKTEPAKGTAAYDDWQAQQSIDASRDNEALIEAAKTKARKG